MTTPFSENLSNLVQLNGKLALELVYAEVGKDTGLLPVNFLLCQIEDVCVAAPPPDEIGAAVAHGRLLLDNIFTTSGKWDKESIRSLGEWTQWMENALGQLSQKQACPALPAQWGNGAPAAEGGTAAPVTASAAHSKTEEIPLVVCLDDVEMVREFISESYEHLHNIELGVLTLEEKSDDADTLNNIFRAFHTFKGGSGLLNLVPVNRLAHELESLLGLARQQKIQIDSNVIDVILEGGDVLKQFTCAIDNQVSGQQASVPIMIATAALIDKVRALVENAGQPDSQPVASKPKAASKPASPAPVAVTAAPAVEAEPEHADESADNVHEQAKPAAESGYSSDKKDLSAQASAFSLVKVATQKLDNLVDLTGEMVIAQSQIVHDPSLQGLADVRLSRKLTQLSRIANELQKTVLSLRMVPIRSAFQKMNRLVRDLSTRLDKTIELKLHGEDTELDRTLVEQLNDPLVHMVRNAVDHGIETTEARLAKGKPATGTIELRALHQGGNIIIEIHDDGAGLDPQRILKKAIAQGLVKPGENLEENEIFDLILEPGFSTAEKVTDLSGRGVGMDVVRRNVEKLRGKIEIRSTLGKGSCFTIYLPLTLAIIDGMMVSVGQQRYILPSLLVRESFRPTAGMISTVQGKGEMVNVRGRLTPLLRLSEYFGVASESTDPTQGVVVVVGYETQQRCLLVDKLLGKQEVVIKALGETFKAHRAFAGAAILGDGRIGLILEVDCLLNLKVDALKTI